MKEPKESKSVLNREDHEVVQFLYTYIDLHERVSNIEGYKEDLKYIYPLICKNSIKLKGKSFLTKKDREILKDIWIYVNTYSHNAYGDFMEKIMPLLEITPEEFKSVTGKYL